MAFEDTSELPLPKAELVTPIASSLKTDVAELKNNNLVIKVNKEIVGLKRLVNETDEEYRRRRIDESMDFIKTHLARSNETKSIMDKRIVTPDEHHFIALADDGYPAPFRIQEKITGEKLVNINLKDLEPNVKSDLATLIKSSLECYRRYGRFMDLVGLVEGKTVAILPELVRHLSPLKNSENIFVTKDGRVALVDIESLDSSPLRNVVKFFSFTVHYWKQLRLT